MPDLHHPFTNQVNLQLRIHVWRNEVHDICDTLFLTLQNMYVNGMIHLLNTLQKSEAKVNTITTPRIRVYA